MDTRNEPVITTAESAYLLPLIARRVNELRSSLDRLQIEGVFHGVSSDELEKLESIRNKLQTRYLSRVH